MRYFLLVSGFLLTALIPWQQADLPLDKIQLPDGFEIRVYAEGVTNARSMTLSPNGTLYVGTRRKGGGKVFAVVDQGDRREVYTIDEGLTSPNGVAFKDGALYVAEINRILRYDDIESNLDNPPAPVVVFDQLPEDGWHGWKYIAFGPDGKLYLPVGAPCNTCDREFPYSSILRINPDGTGLETFAYGVRNTVDFDWHPETGDLWFTDNGRDNMGDDIPDCELNRATDIGQHFGFPYFHAGDVPDPEFAGNRKASDYIAPSAKLGAHVAPLGMEFYEGSQFPEKYRGQIFIAQHGSWNRSSKVGYRVVVAHLNESGEVGELEVFAEGWLQDEESWGRPVDVEVTADGALLVSDDVAGVIYKISYSG